MALEVKKPTKFTSVTPGSRVRISSALGTYEPYEGSVIEMRPEYGPQRIPALVLNTGSDDPAIVLSDGQHLVTILLDARALISQAPPAGTQRMRTIPVPVEAFQFTGGVDNATKAITFAAGLMHVRWQPAGPEAPEALIVTTLTGEQRVDPGGWLVRTLPTEEAPTVRAWVESGDTFLEQYEHEL